MQEWDTPVPIKWVDALPSQVADRRSSALVFKQSSPGRGLYQLAATGRYVQVSADGLGVAAEAFGAVGDMIYAKDGAIDAGTNVFNSAGANFADEDGSSFAGGKVIVINGAGLAGIPLVTTVTAVNGSTQLQLAHNASVTVAGSALYYYGTDNWAAFQAAINAFRAAGGGRILLGPYNYLISDTLMLPGIEIQNEQVAVIEFVGAIGPMRSHWNNTNQVLGGDNDVELMIKGQSIIQLANTAIGKKLMDVDWITPLSQAPSGAQVLFQNLVFRTPVGVNVTALDLTHAYSVRMFDFNVEVAEPPSNLPPPVPGARGIVLPRVGNGAQIVLERIGVAGFDTGIRHSEHGGMEDIWLYRCRYGIIPEAANIGSKYGRMCFTACPYGIVSADNVPTVPKPYISGGPIEFEDSFSIASPAPHWTAAIAHIYDPANNLRGEIIHHRNVGFVGHEDGITAIGGSKLLRRQVGRRYFDGGVRGSSALPGTGLLPFACALTSPIGEDAPPEENRGQEWMLQTGVTFVVFDGDGAYFATGNGNCFARLEAEQENYAPSVRIDIDSTVTVQCQAGVCVKYIQGGAGLTGGTFVAATIEILPGAINRLRLFKVINGTSVDLGVSSAVAFVPGADHLLRVDYNSGNLQVWLDGISRIGPIVPTPATNWTADDVALFGKSKVHGVYSYIAPLNDDRTTQFRQFSNAPL